LSVGVGAQEAQGAGQPAGAVLLGAVIAGAPDIDHDELVSSTPYCFLSAALNSGLASTACSHSICSSAVIVGCTPGTCRFPGAFNQYGDKTQGNGPHITLQNSPQMTQTPTQIKS
jgi:hypothetical protein